MLMNLGALVSITAQAPPNFTLLLFDNGVYEVTGAQATPGSAAIRSDRKPINFVAAATACGFQTVFEFTRIDHWTAAIRGVIDADGPTFARIAVAPVPGAVGPRSPSPGPPRAREFAAVLQDRSDHG